MRHWILALAAIGLFVIMGQADAAVYNLLVNPGFETGDFSGWTVGGNSMNTGVASDGTPISGFDPPFAWNYVNVRSGDYAGYALVKDGTDPVERIILT